ncbi:hypothetical protein ACQEVB_10900 [Pseudonocardia sp. CA-107938]|uniref:hypothetical protein n=1 Tax=Pseudonocardia sp. CA-107938 TaxID=3240021 RepID=UPI003D92890E
MNRTSHLPFNSTAADADHHRRILQAEAERSRLVRIARAARRRAPEVPPAPPPPPAATRVTRPTEETSRDRRYAVSR